MRPLHALLCLLFAACSSTKSSHLAATNALGPYSAAVEAHGLVFLSGKVGAHGASFAEEAENALVAVETELARLGLTTADVVSVDVFLTDMALYPELNQVYAKHFPAPHPARACVAVSALPGGARVEIKAVAAR